MDVDKQEIKSLEREFKKELKQEELGSSKENKLRNILTKIRLTNDLCHENRAYIIRSSDTFEEYALKEKLSICTGCHAYGETECYSYCIVTKLKK